MEGQPENDELYPIALLIDELKVFSVVPRSIARLRRQAYPPLL